MDYPALQDWFLPTTPPLANPDVAVSASSSHPPHPSPSPRLNADYLSRYSDTIVSLELTTTRTSDGVIEDFERVNAPLSLFLQYVELAGRGGDPGTHKHSIYLAQSSLSSLPQDLLASLPTPDYVTSYHAISSSSSTSSHTNTDNVYGSSLWLGLAPTETPLHRDPNHGLLMMLSGRKRVRVVSPDVGKEVFNSVRARVSRSGPGTNGYGSGRGRVRGKEMMIGSEREGLDAVVWGERRMGDDAVKGGNGKRWEGFEGVLDAGDAVFLPMGWWHSLKGVGEGVVGSVSKTNSPLWYVVMVG